MQLADASTGYKLRKHIAAALQQRSQAIRNALERYNAAAAALRPPAPKLSWDKVVEYAFLADFDILRDSRQDVRQHPWAKRANRLLMDQYFKTQRAHEEIARLNIEIKRVLTHIQDEENYLLSMEEETHHTDPTLAFHISNYRLERTRYSDLHIRRFNSLSKLGGFTGNLIAGESADPTLREVGRSSPLSHMEVDHRQPAGEIWADEDDLPVDATRATHNLNSTSACTAEGVSSHHNTRLRSAEAALEDEEGAEEAILEAQFQIFSLAEDRRPLDSPAVER